MKSKPLVRYKGRYWVLAAKRNRMVHLLSNGESALVPESEIIYYNPRKKGEKK